MALSGLTDWHISGQQSAVTVETNGKSACGTEPFDSKSLCYVMISLQGRFSSSCLGKMC